MHVGFRLLLGLYAAAPAFAVEAPVAVFWVGADGGDSVRPHVDISAIEGAFESNGYRILRADGASATVLAQVIASDREAHPSAYQGRVVPFIVHGSGAISTSVDAETELLLELPKKPAPQIREQDLIAAFLLGIGDEAKGEITVGACLSGRRCREVPLAGSDLAERITRLVVITDGRAANAEEPGEKKRSQLLERLLDVLLAAPPKGTTLAAPVALPPPAPPKRVPGGGDFRSTAEREALTQAIETKGK